MGEQTAARNGGLMQVVIRSYDPPCSSLSGLPPLDLDAMFAAAVAPN